MLIVRGRPCVPTEAGLQLCRHVEQVELLQHELNERMNALAGMTDPVAATIRISVNNDSLATWLSQRHQAGRKGRALASASTSFPMTRSIPNRGLKTGEALAVVTAHREGTRAGLPPRLARCEWTTSPGGVSGLLRGDLPRRGDARRAGELGVPRVRPQGHHSGASG